MQLPLALQDIDLLLHERARAGLGSGERLGWYEALEGLFRCEAKAARAFD